jgi:hypothetical protein
MKRTPTNGVSSLSIGMSRMLLGSAPTRTLGATAWGITHMVYRTDLREWTNPHGVRFTDWSSSCGATGTESGHVSSGTASGLSSLDFAHRGMLCKDCCAGMLA